jgi:hypothetical protein
MDNLNNIRGNSPCYKTATILHYPFVEENSLFTEALDVFLHGEEKT